MGKKILTLLVCAIFSASMAVAQTRTVTGTVVDSETGDPIPGAKVMVQGTSLGAVADSKGTFVLKNLPKEAKKVIVSFMGMKTADVTLRDGMKVILIPDAKAMDEVMVVAYGSATRSSFTGSAAVVSSDIIDKKISSNVTSALAGTAAGVQYIASSGDPVNNAPTIRIRGIGSINAGNGPLYVVDGVPYDGAISAINPADVESMTVLKDGASTALYGSRASNGVVIITTKKGRGHKSEITFDAKWGGNSRLIPNYDVIKSPGQYYETIFRRLYNSEIAAGKTSAEAYASANNRLYDAGNGGLGYQIYTLPQGENLIGTNFRLNPNATLGYSDGQYYYTPDDWADAALQNGFRQEYNINFRGSTDKLSYYGGGSYLSDEGIVRNSNMKRYTARANIEYQAKNWLRFTTAMNYAHTDAIQPSYTTSTWASSGNVFYVVNTIAPIYPLYVRDANGNIMYENGRPIYDSNQTNFKRPGTVGNAVRDNFYDKDNSTRDVFDGKWGIIITPVKGLRLSANIAAYSSNTRNSALGSAFGSASSVDGYAAVTSSRLLTVTQQYMANYKTDFNGSRHSLDVLLGYEQRNLISNYHYGYNDHLFNPEVGELGNALGTSGKRQDSYTDKHVLEGILSRVQYSYDDRFFVDASYRRDASSRFAPGHRWGNFGSLGFAWNMKKESWLRGVKGIDMLKFKVSYGLVGNESLGNYYVYADMYRPTYNEGTKEYSTTLIQKGNPELTWESNHNFNIGFDFNLFKNRLNGTIEYFVKKTIDMLFYKDFPLSAGYGTDIQLPVNVGNVLNNGIEITLEGVAVRTKDLDWRLNLNMTHYKNEILSLDDQYKEDGIKYSNSILREGGSIYETYMLKFAGVDQATGKALYYKNNADGTLGTTTDATAADKYDCGTTLPDLYGGFGTSLSWKGLDFSMQFSYSLGGQIYDGTYQSLMCSDASTGKGNNIHRDILNAWTTENSITNVPMFTTDTWGGLAQTACDRFLTSSNYLSINNITLGYTLPKNWVNKLKLSNVRIYVTGENLAVFSKRQGLDPRYTIATGSMTGGSGRNSGAYGGIRSIVGGISLKF